VIQVRELCNRFGSQVIHENLDLDVMTGEILGVVGGSGTGKTVLLRTIVGLNRPTSGHIRVFGQGIQELSAGDRSLIEQRLGVLFQGGALFSSLNLQENVAVPLIEHAGLSRPDAEHLARVKLALTGLPPEAALKYPAELSGGMVKRAALARALALDPEILFLDEPTAGLDPIGAADMWDVVAELKASGVTIILTTHYIEEAEAIADRIGVIAHGELLLVEDKADLMARMGKKQLRIELAEPTEDIPKSLAGYDLARADDGRSLTYTYDTTGERTGITTLLADLQKAGLQMKDIQTQQSSLEDIFVGLVKETA